jgi:hypothetical protein
VAVIEWLKGWDDAAPTDPDEGDREEVAWQLFPQLCSESEEHKR